MAWLRKCYALPIRLAGLTLICGLLLNVPQLTAAEADKRWQYCSTQFAPPNLLADSAVKGVQLAEDEILVTADKARIEKLRIYHFEGNVVLQQAQGNIFTDHAVYDRLTNKIYAEGSVRYQTGSHVLLGNKADVEVENDVGSISDAEFWLLENHLRGRAQSISILSEDVLQLDQVLFTSCDKENESWVLKASSLHLDLEKNVGKAKHARLEFMKVPFLYLPYMSLPIKGRKTGFLAPNFGTSNASGTEVSLPYYFNIAPDQDATLTARYYSKRGTQFSGEYRYLHRRHEGELYAEHLPDDREYGEEDRTYATLNHSGNPGHGWRTQLHYSYASDGDYLADFWNDLSASSLTHLERVLDVDYQAPEWRAKAKVQTFQTLDETIAAVDRPYQRLPQLQVITNPLIMDVGLETSATAELVQFYRSEGVTGTRFDVAPEISWPYRAAAGFIDPSVKLRYSQYQLDNQDALFAEQISRTVPQVSLDSGLIFERDAGFSEAGLIQTLEPRLYYLYVPYRDQDDIPVFDTILPLFSYSELFRDNRFSGVDRIGDANQLSFSLSTRFLSESGNERLLASLGQIFYLKDQKVALPGGAPSSRSQSVVAGVLRSQWSRQLGATASVEWDQIQQEVDKGSVQFRYQFNRDKITHLSYRYEKDAIDQMDFSALWPLRPQWKAYVRYYYSFLNSITLETVGGIEYENCCWSVRFVYRDYITDLATDSRNDSVWFELELKGLASVGRKVRSAFETGILPGI
ncbi:MAG: LPS-assembly protein LptD [Gammaproteobacteria bacterium]|nr:LPS-assembly protein LptD [Gammaproteobacteria bacterium]